MTRGRKPDVLSAVNSGQRAVLARQQQVVVVKDSPKPPEIAANENLSALWDIYVGNSASYRPEDAPVLAQMVFELETARQCRERCMDENGSIIAVSGRGPRDEITGEYMSFGINPWYEAMGKATDRALKLADQLGCTPLARARLGLAQASGAVMALSIADQVRKVVDGK